MAMETNNIDVLLGKLRDLDQDLRAMATSDLLDTLKKTEGTLAKDEGDRCMKAFVKLLYDSHNHIQNLAMGCLGQAIGMVDSETTKDAVTSICTEIKNRASTESTALSVGLRVMSSKIAENAKNKALLGSLACPIVSVLTDKPSLPADVVTDVFSALSDVLSYAGAQVAADDETVDQIQNVLLEFINHSNMGVRRRATAVLGAFVVHVPGERSEQALETIFQRYEACSQASEKSILLRVLVTIARQCPERVSRLVPAILDREIQTLDEDNHDARTTALLVFETLVCHCTEAMAPWRDKVYEIGVDAIRYDPNGNFEMDDMDTDSEGDDLGDEYEEDIYEDEDDDSWSVRLGGVKLLAALAKSKLYTSAEVVQNIGSVLVTSFKEREDAVRAEVLVTYAGMVDTVQEEAADALQEQTPKVVKSALSAIQNYSRSTETKQLVFAIFSRLVSAKHDILDGSLPEILPLVTSFLEADDTSGVLQSTPSKLVKANLKLEVLDFIHVFVLRSQVTNEAAEFLVAVKGGVKDNLSSKTFQVPSASFNAATGMVALLASDASSSSAEFIGWYEDMARLAASLVDTDDQGTKESAYVFIGAILQTFGDQIKAETREQLLEVLVQLKGGAIDAPVVLGAFAQAVSQPTKLPKESVVAAAPRVLQIVGALLRQGSTAAVVAACLNTVTTLAQYGPEALGRDSDSVLQSIIAVISRAPESPPVSALHAFAAVCPSVSEGTMRSISKGLLQLFSATNVYDGQSADAMSELFYAVGHTFGALVDGWREEIAENWLVTYGHYAKQRKESSNEAIQAPFPTAVLTNAAQSINALYTGRYQADAQPWSSDFLSAYIFQAPKSNDAVAKVCLGLRALGYAAADKKVPQNDQLSAQLSTHLQSASDDVRSEAAMALGRYVGCYTDLFPSLFAGATAAGGGDSTYAVSKLQAVKVAVEQIVGVGHDSDMADSIWSMVLNYVQNIQDALPDVLAQTLAVLATTFPIKFVPQLASLIASTTRTSTKAFFITTFRTILADRQLSAECEAKIKQVLTRALSGIADDDVSIRRLSLLALYAIVQGKPGLLEEHVSEIEPSLFQQTIVNESLIRTINMGLIKKRVDDGLDARRCAFQCVHMLVRMLPDAVDGRKVVDSVVRGISDDHDIRLLVLQIIHESVAALTPLYAERLDDIADAIREVQSTKLPKKVVSQEIEKHHAVLKSSVSVLVAFVPVAKSAPMASDKFDSLLAETADPSNTELSGYYKELAE
ncbi:hypothetical protein H4R22_001152 [Coemansia sp. RSA 1290]|nr:hypothetical protein H4R22_001152 [Coemansia sp. RSA 1290]KAJ2650878.1 hypothetical protein IWW40_002140 [Coemansia sp. RSA 1250]